MNAHASSLQTSGAALAGRASVFPPPSNGLDDAALLAHFCGAAAHNTVCVDGRQQRRSSPRPIKENSRHARGSVRHKISGPAPETKLLERFHSAHLDLFHGQAPSHAYDAVHQRCVAFVDRRYWIVSDWLRAPTQHDYRLNFQLGAHTRDRTELSIADGLRLNSPGLLILQPARGGVHHALRPSRVSARHGDKQAAASLRSTVVARDADFDTVLMPWHGEEPAAMVEDLAVEADGLPSPEPHRAQRITLVVDGALVVDTWFVARGVAAKRWRIGGFELCGRWAHWREAVDGRVLYAVSHAGGSLRDMRSDAHAPVAIETAELA